MMKPKGVVAQISWGLRLAAATSFLAVAVAAAQPPTESTSTMRRLTDEQYRNAIADIFGEDIEFAGRFDPVLRPRHGLQIQGVSQIAVSPAGFEQYDKMARAIAAQVVDERHRDLLVGCQPTVATLPDDACAAAFFRRAGELVFRRPVTPSDVQRYVFAARAAATLTNDFYGGMADSLGVMLASARFLFDVDVTEPDPPRRAAARCVLESLEVQLLPMEHDAGSGAACGSSERHAAHARWTDAAGESPSGVAEPREHRAGVLRRHAGLRPD